jgi:hypothetical protein
MPRSLPLLVVLGAVLPASAAADCPPGTIDDVPSPAAVRDSLHAGTSTGDSLVAHYDLPAGTLSGMRRRMTAPLHLAIELADEFTITGLPPGTSVALTADWAFRAAYDLGSAPGGVAIRARLLEGAANVVEFQESGLDRREAIQLPIAAVAVTPFTLRSRVEFTARDGRARSEGALTFYGIPAGAALVSCRGYRQDGVVPALPLTWGAVKSRYR